MGRRMPEATVEGIAAHAGATVTLRGWLAARRSSGKLHFLALRDGTGTIQCVVSKGDVSPRRSRSPTIFRRSPPSR